MDSDCGVLLAKLPTDISDLQGAQVWPILFAALGHKRRFISNIAVASVAWHAF
jgi:hypothetical protein